MMWHQLKLTSLLILGLCLLPAKARSGSCETVITLIRGTAMALIPRSQPLTARYLLQSKDTVGSRSAHFYNLGSKGHLVIHAGQIFQFQPYRIPETGAVCNYRLHVRELKTEQEIKDVLGWTLSFVNKKHSLNDSEHSVLTKAIEQAQSNSDQTTTMFEDGLDQAFSLGRDQSEYLTGRGRWIVRSAVIATSLLPYPFWAPSNYADLLKSRLTNLNRSAPPIGVGPLAKIPLSFLDSALDDYDYTNRVSQGAPPPSTLLHIITEFDPQEAPRNRKELASGLNPYSDFDLPQNSIPASEKEPWGILTTEAIEPSATPWGLLTDRSKLRAFKEHLGDPQTFDRIMNSVLGEIPTPRDDLKWAQSSPANGDYPAYFLPNHIIHQFWEHRSDLKGDQNRELPAEFLLFMMNSDFGRSHPLRMKWLQKMYDSSFKSAGAQGADVVYPWREIYEAVTGRNLQDVLFEASSGKVLREPEVLASQNFNGSTAQFSPSARYLITQPTEWGDAGSSILTDLVTGATSVYSGRAAFDFSADEKVSVVGQSAGTLQITHLDSGKETIIKTGLDIAAVRLSPDKKLVAASSERYGKVKVFDSQTGKELHSLEHKPWDREHHGAITFLEFTPDSSQLISSMNENGENAWLSTPNQVKILNLTTGKEDMIPLKEDKQRSVSLSADGRILAVCCSPEGQIVIRNMETGSESSIDMSGVEVRALQLSSDGLRLAVADSAGSVGVFDLSSSAKISLITHLPGARGFQTSPDRKLFALTTNQNRVHLFDLENAREISIDSQQTGSIIAISPDHRKIAFADPFSKIHIYDQETRETKSVVFEAYVSSLEFTPDGKTLLVGDRLGGFHLLHEDQINPGFIQERFKELSTIKSSDLIPQQQLIEVRLAMEKLKILGSMNRASAEALIGKHFAASEGQGTPSKVKNQIQKLIDLVWPQNP